MIFTCSSRSRFPRSPEPSFLPPRQEPPTANRNPSKMSLQPNKADCMQILLTDGEAQIDQTAQWRDFSRNWCLPTEPASECTEPMTVGRQCYELWKPRHAFMGTNGAVRISKLQTLGNSVSTGNAMFRICLAS